MTETRLFDVTFGVDGSDQAVLLTAVPVWEARIFAMRALQNEADDIEERERECADRMRAVASRLQVAELGSIVFGHVERYEGVGGRTMFVALLPTGTDYRDAGFKPGAYSRLTGRPTFTTTSTEAA
jgi:hypothetical protein